MEINHVTSEDSLQECSELVITLKKLILKYDPYTTEIAKDLLTNTAHMFVNLPKEAISELLIDIKDEAACSSTTEVIIKYDNFDTSKKTCFRASFLYIPLVV